MTVEPASGHQHRLHALCPYFAMFPPAFARENILRHTEPGDIVLDPFSGRGTTLLEALLEGRQALAADINPVAYCVTAAKAFRPRLAFILDAIDRFEGKYYRADPGQIEAARENLPEFFRRAFSSETLRQLLFLRKCVHWRYDPDHRFVMALLLGHLHGESNRSDYYCSNQMPHSISTKPGYSLRYWREEDLHSPRRDVFDLLRDRADYRLQQGAPRGKASVSLCDVRLVARYFQSFRGRVSAVITSPPYFDTTRFEEDQWLRLWLLGGAPHPTYHRVSRDDRYDRWDSYWAFIRAAWRGIAPLLKRSAVLVCRLGARGVDHERLREGFRASVRAVWPTADAFVRARRTALPNRQAAVLNPDAVGCRFESDFAVSIPDPEPILPDGR